MKLKNSKIGVITDSSAGFQYKELIKMNDLGFLPLLINFYSSRKEQANDWENLDNVEENTNSDNPLLFKSEAEEKAKNEEFYDNITKKKLLAKTTQTPLGQMAAIFEKQLTKFEKVIVITISKHLSGQYNTAYMLSQEPQFKNKIFVYDSLGVSIINWLLTVKAYQMSKNPSHSINDIFFALNAIRDNYKAFIIPQDINYLKRGGRISSTASLIVGSLKIQPVLSFNGIIEKFNIYRTFKKAIDQILSELQIFQKLQNKKIKIFLIHAYGDEQKLKIIEKSLKSYNFTLEKKVKLANVITAHTGVGTFSLMAFADNNEELLQGKN